MKEIWFGPEGEKRFRLSVDAHGAATALHALDKEITPRRQVLELLAKFVFHPEQWFGGDRKGQYRSDVKEIRALLGHFSAIENQRSMGYRFAWKLHTPPLNQPRGVLRALNVPEWKLAREGALNKLKSALLRQTDDGQTTLLTAMAGTGGIGKSVLAQLAMDDIEIQQRFPDGIIALTIGREPTVPQVESEIRQIPKALGESPQGWEWSTAREELEAIFATKKILLVLDDVWDHKDLTWRPRILGQSAILITTRDSEVGAAFPGLQLVEADYLEPGEDRELLAHHSGIPVESLPPASERILHHCNRLAYAVSMAGSMVETPEMWNAVAEALEESRIHQIGIPREDTLHRNVYEVIHTSVEFLAKTDPECQQRLLQCSVFPDDTAIPESVFAVLWDTHGSDYHITLNRLAKRHLLTWQHGVVTFHDLQMDYLRSRTAEAKPTAHARFVNNYQKRCGQPADWALGPNDGYLFQNLVNHLWQAGRGEEASMLVHRLPWLEAKLKHTHINALLADFCDHDANAPLARGIRQAAHILERHPDVLAQQILARVRDHRKVENLLTECRERKGLQPQQPSLEADPALIRTLAGHSRLVLHVALTPDGQRALSASADNTLKLWNLESGEVIRTLTGHSGPVQHVALTPDGQRALSASDDNTLKLWNLESGEEIHTLAGHSRPVWHVALTPDGQRALSASADTTLKLWNLESGDEIHTLAGHSDSVWHVALTPDGQRALSASDDNTLKLWNLHSGEIIATFHADAAIYRCAVETNRIVAGDASGRVHILLMPTSPPSQPQPPQ